MPGKARKLRTASVKTCANPIPLTYFDDMLFGTTYNPPEYNNEAPTDRALANYYKEVSYGAVNVGTFNLPSSLGWANIGHPHSYYCNQDNGFGAYPNNVQGLVIDAIKALDPVIDFSQYAVNGVIPNLMIVHTGSGAEWSGTLELIWSHAWDLSEGTGLDGFMADGVKINSYAMMPEIGGDTTGVWGPPTGPYPPTVGVFAHEFAHVLGLRRILFEMHFVDEVLDTAETPLENLLGEQNLDVTALQVGKLRGQGIDGHAFDGAGRPFQCVVGEERPASDHRPTGDVRI